MNSPVLNQYDPANAVMLCLASAAAYDPCCGDFQKVSIITRENDLRILFVETDTDLTVAFRGTADLRNWLTDLDCAYDIEDGCLIHRGFNRALDGVSAQIHARVKAAIAAGKRVWLTGHSLGGALAMLYAFKFFNLRHSTLGLSGIYTFGQPRVGNAAFHNSYAWSDLRDITFRIVHADDIVPRVPWLLGSYRHAGHEVFYGDGIAIAPKPGEGGPPDPPMIDSSIWQKLPFDTRNAWREIKHGKLALLNDHHVSTYLALFSDGRAVAPRRPECVPAQ